MGKIINFFYSDLQDKLGGINIERFKVNKKKSNKNRARKQIIFNLYIINQMNQDKNRPSQNKWTLQEDQLLWDLRQNKKIISWKRIAIQINSHFDYNQRSGKQCRERFMNYVRFGANSQKNIAWTLEQDHLLFNKIMTYGLKWVIISKELQQKSQNSVKNRFYNAIGKMRRKIKKIQLKKKLKNKKPISSNRLIKLFQQLSKYLGVKKSKMAERKEIQDQHDQFSILADCLISFATNNSQQMEDEQLFSLVMSIHKFFQTIQASYMGQNQLVQSLSSQKQKNRDNFQSSKGLQIPKPEEIDGQNESYPFESKLQIDNQKQQCLIDEQLIQLSELSQEHFKSKPENLEQELCNILEKEYVPQSFQFYD